jgi:hypothetical protein
MTLCVSITLRSSRPVGSIAPTTTEVILARFLLFISKLKVAHRVGPLAAMPTEEYGPNVGPERSLRQL